MKIMGFSGWSGSGKTTLIERLIPCFTARGLRVALIKHAHHAFESDQPGKDAQRQRQAGATEVLGRAANRWALRRAMPTAAQVRFWDRTLVGTSRWLDRWLGYRVGKSLMMVWTRPAGQCTTRSNENPPSR